jgi:hypothetical protein
MNQISKTLMTAILSWGATSAYAAPVQLAAGDIIVEYDLDNFSLNVDGTGYDSSVFLVTPLANGVRLGFSGLLNVYASSYFNYSPQTKEADYSALFSLAPTAGKTITGFTITYSGGYSVEMPGSAGASGVGMSVGGSSGGGPFSISSNFTGMGVPTLSGQLSATGEITFVEVLDDFQDVLVGYQPVLDYCEVENPEVCYYHDEPVYEQVPIYHQEMDLGEASVYIDSITISADVAPVPLPPSGLLMGAGLLGLGLRKMLNRGSVNTGGDV